LKTESGNTWFRSNLMDDLDPEVYALDEQGRPVTKYYTPLTGPDGKPTGVFRADQARGRYMRGPSGRMEEALRPTERRSMADRILGRDDPRALNERTWIDKLAGVPNAISRSVDDAGADMAAGLGVVSAKMGTTPTVQIKTESGRVIAERPRMAEETFFGEMATDLRERGKQFSVHPNDKQNFLAYQLPTGATQMLMQMGTAKLGGTSAAVTAFSTQAAGRGYEEAKSFGATEDDALLAGLLNAPVGALEMLPISGAFKRVNQATGGTFLQSLKRMIVDGVEGGAEEMVQEALSQTLSNKVAQQLYDEERNLLQGTAEGMKQGAGVGGLMNMLLSGMTRTRMGIDAARKANAPEQVWAEYIPPPEAVDAEWLSDETGVARREAGVSGPARHYAVPPVGPDRQIGLPQLPPGVRMERTLDGKLTRFDGSDMMQAAPEAAPLTTEEQAQLPVNVAKRNTEVALKQQQDRRAAYENRSKKFERLNKMMDRFDKAMGAIPESFVQENESDFDELSKAIEDNNPGRFQEVANVLAKKARNIRSREGKKAKHPEPVQEAPLKPVTQETLTDGAAPESDLTMEERAQLPLERIQARDQQQSAEWRRPMEEKRSEAWERLQNNARRLPMRENDHPVAQMRADILKRGGIIYDKSIEADVWDKVPKNYKTSKQAAAAGKGIMWEDLINETQAMGLNFDASTTDPTELLDLLTGPKTNEDGTPRFPPSWYQEETQRLNEFWAPKLTEEQMKQTPVGEVLAQFNPDAPTLRNFTVKPDDLELGDIIRIEDTLYQVQERGSVKVLQDGKTVPLDPESEYVVNGVVKRNNPMHKRLRDLYNRIEAAQDTSAPDPSAMPQGPWPPEGIDDYIRATIEDQMDSAEPPPAGVRTESGRTFTLAQQSPENVIGQPARPGRSEVGGQESIEDAELSLIPGPHQFKDGVLLRGDVAAEGAPALEWMMREPRPATESHPDIPVPAMIQQEVENVDAYFEDKGDVWNDPENKFSAIKVGKDLPVVSLDEARSQIDQWRRYARALKQSGYSSGKTVISLFDRTSAWSMPWQEAGFDVRTLDLETDGVNIMEIDREWLEDNGFLDLDVAAVLAACPCTDFAVSGARWWKQKDADGRTQKSIDLVNHTLDLISFLKPDVWALENPVGRITKVTDLPDWRLVFNPHNFGNPYSKRTQIYGDFNPELPMIQVENSIGSYAHQLRGDKPEEKALRSVTPEGFSYAFFMANHQQFWDRKLTEPGENPRPETRSDTLTLEAVTPEQLEAEKDRRAALEAKRKAEEQLNTVRKGNTGDLGQSALFNDVETDLFAGPSAEQQNRGMVQEPAANYSVDPVQSNEVVSYLGALNVQGNTEAIAKEQLDLFDRIEASPNLPYNVGGRSDAPAGRQGSDVGGQQAALSKAFRNPLDPDSWQGVQLRPGKPATSVLHDRFKGERTAWPVTGLKVEGPGDAMALAMMLRSPYQESSKLLALDDNGKVVDARVFAVGVLNASLMHPREAFGNLPKNAKHIVLLHNHPSGDPAPSPEDIKVSKDFIAAAELMGLNVVDHVITDDWKGMSLLNSGMVSFPGAARVAYNQNQVMDRKNTNNQVYDFTVNEPDIPEWSLVPRGDLKLVHSPDDVKRIVRALRQGNPGTGFVVLMNTRNGLNGILAIDFDKGDWMQSMTRGMTDGRAAGGILVLPDQSKGGSELATARQAIEAAKKINIKLLDVIGPTINKTHSYDDMLSYREAGLVAFEVFESPRNPYEAAQRLRDAGALPEGMSVGEAAVYTVQESLAEYIAGKQKSVNKVVEKFAPKPQGPELQGSYDSLDPNVDARLKKNESLPRRKPWDIDAEHLREMARSFTRAYPEIKDTQGAVIYLLESTAHVSGAAEAISKGALSEIVGKLGTEQYKLFERVLVARDVARSVEEGLYEGKEIPFGWPSLEAVRQDLARWEADAALNPEIRNAMQQRSSFMQSLRDDLVAAKLLPEAVQDVDDYFHRLVTEYMEASRHTGGADGEGMKQSDSGFQKRRTGGGDFIIDYLTAEHDVITHALAQLRFKEIRDGLQSLVDRSGELKQVARTRNLEAVHGGAENYNKVRAVLNEVAGLRAESKYMGAGGSDGAEISELLKTIEKFDVLRPFRAMKAQAVSIFEKATGEDVGPNPNDTMNDAMNEKYGQGAVWAGIQWFKAIAEEEAFIKSQLGNDYMRWKGASLDSRVVPEGFVSWRPKSGHRMFKALSVSEAVIEGILDGQRELLQEDVKEVLVSAGLYPEWIVPENVARALNRMSHDKMAKGSLLPVDRVLQRATKKWKAYKLMAPQHTVKYYFNNFTGDLDFALAAAPEITRYVKAATIESTRLNLGKGKMSKEMEQLSMNGVIGGQVRGEIASIRSDELFSMITGEKPHLIQKYMSKLGPLQKQREDILRIAAYRYYKDQIRQGKRPLGASNFEQMNDLYERGMFDEAAYMLAKQALIDYDNPTQVGQMVKDRYIPFYRWREGNAIRYARLVRNSFIEGSGYRDRAKKVGPVLAGSIARSAAQRAIQISIFGALVQAFNHIFFPEEEELMDKSGRKGHLILSGTNEQGTFNSVRMEGSLTSFLGTIGMQNAGEVIDDLRSGNATAGESLGQIGKDLTNDWLQGVSPFAKTSYEAAMKTQTWPDVFNPRPVYDRTEHMLKIISADKLYRRVTDRPMRPGHESGLNPKNLLTFTTDAGEAAYWSVRGMSRDWQQQNSDANYSPGRPTDKNVALKYFRQAHQYGDQAAADKWLNEYLDQGGTIRTMHKSLNNQHPLIGLNDAERKQFISTLSDRDRDLYNASLKYYQQQLRSENLDQSQIDRVMQKRYEERRKLITM
jgi:hypothetical protein